MKEKMFDNIIGCDLNAGYCQISCLKDGKQEPVTSENIPYPVPDLYGRAARGESADVLERFRKFLGEVFGNYGKIDSLTFAVPETNVDVVRMLKGVGRRLGIPKTGIGVQDYRESFCDYMLYQPKDLWRFEAALLHCDRREIRAFMLRKIKTGAGKGRNLFVTVDEVADADIEELSDVYPVLNVDRAREADKKLERFVAGIFDRRLVSSVFLVGEGFENNWYPGALKLLCNGRRAFVGNNLYSRGACYAAYRRMFGYEDAPVYLDETRMTDQICVKARIDGKDRWYPIVPWGRRWYEADIQREVLLEDNDDIEIHIESLTDSGMRVEKIPLDGLPELGKYTVRLLLKIMFPDEKHCVISLSDAGFGEFYPATDFSVEKEIILGGSDGQFNSLS